MKLLVFSDPLDIGAKACAAGLAFLGHDAIFRNPSYARPNEVEKCDMAVAFDAQFGSRVRSIYSMPGIPVIVCGASLVDPVAYLSVTLDIWGGVAPVECPKRRAVEMGLMRRATASEPLGDSSVMLLIDGEPVAEMERGDSVESVVSRIAHSIWTADEISTGAPFQFIFDVMAGKSMVESVTPRLTAPPPVAPKVEQRRRARR